MLIPTKGMMAVPDSALESMRALRDQIEERLQATEDYRALRALDKAIAEMQGAERPVPPWRRVTAPAPTPIRDRLPQADAAARVMDQRDEPIPIAELVPLVRQAGAHVGGNDPEASLSSTLSKDERFRSVRFNGRPAWWFRSKSYPGETEEERRQEAQVDAADEAARAEREDDLVG